MQTENPNELPQLEEETFPAVQGVEDYDIERPILLDETKKGPSDEHPEDNR